MTINELKDKCAMRHNIYVLEASLAHQDNPIERARLAGMAEAYGKVLDYLQEIKVGA